MDHLRSRGQLRGTETDSSTRELVPPTGQTLGGDGDDTPEQTLTQSDNGEERLTLGSAVTREEPGRVYMAELASTDADEQRPSQITREEHRPTPETEASADLEATNQVRRSQRQRKTPIRLDL